jgi:hypothetical protein
MKSAGGEFVRVELMPQSANFIRHPQRTIFSVAAGLIILGSLGGCEDGARTGGKAASSPSPVLATSEFKGRAVVVGVGRYPGSSGLATLQSPDWHARRIGQGLSRAGYDVDLLLSPEANQSRIVSAISRAASQKPVDVILFYFTGHGTSASGKDYVIPFDGRLDDVAGTSIAIEDIVSTLDASPTIRRAIFIDACRDRVVDAAMAGPLPGFAQKFKASKGTRMLFSTNPGERSYEDPQIGAVFSHFFARALESKVASKEDLITFSSLTDYLTTSVGSWSFQNGRTQQPYEVAKATGDFVLAALGQTGGVGQGFSCEGPPWLVCGGPGTIPGASDQARSAAGSFLGMIEAGRLEDAYAAMHAATRQQLLLEQFMMMFGAWGQMGQALSRQETRLDLYQDPPGMTGQVLSVFYAVTYSQARFTVNVGLMQDVDGTWRVIGAYAAPVPAAARGDTANAGS